MNAALVVVAVVIIVASAALLRAGLVRYRRITRAPAPEHWPSVLALQRAGSGRAAGALLDRLGAKGRDAFAQGLRVDDRMIIPGYVVLLASLCLLSIAAVRHAASGEVEVVGTAVAVLAALLAVVAGGLDLVENRLTVTVLGAWHDIPLPEQPNEAEASERHATRRGHLAAIEEASQRVAAVSAWKFRLLGLVLAWLLTAGVVAVAQALG